MEGDANRTVLKWQLKNKNLSNMKFDSPNNFGGFKLGAGRKFKATAKANVRKNHFGIKNDLSVPGTPVIRKDDLAPGIKGEANKDGSIFLNAKELTPGSLKERQVLRHEMKHIVDMKIGRLDYDDGWLQWDGVKYPRKDGHIKYKGKWQPEGSKNFPWEQH